jgi:sialidase-1
MLPSIFWLSSLILLQPAEAATPRADVTPLFVSGENGYGRYRIPSLYVTPKQTVLAFCEGRVKPAGLTGDIDIVLRRSTDGGRTWSPLQVVADDGPNTLGNPCPVVDRTTGTLWLPFTRSLGQDTEKEITDGTSDGRTQVWLTHSTDDGLTWAKPTNISAQATRSEWTWYGTGPGFGLQLPSGRLLIPSYHAVEKSGIYRVHSLYSDDHGATWQIGADLRDETTEPQAALRTDGTLYVNARNISPRNQMEIRHRVVAASRDGGATWTDVREDPTLTDSSCEASVLVYSGLAAGEKSIWVFSNPPGPGRRRLTVRLSYDEGRTWPVAKLIEPVASEYSSLTRLPDGAIGLLYERDVTPPGEYRVDIVFMRLTIGDVERP